MRTGATLHLHALCLASFWGCHCARIYASRPPWRNVKKHLSQEEMGAILRAVFGRLCARDCVLRAGDGLQYMIVFKMRGGPLSLTIHALNGNTDALHVVSGGRKNTSV